MRDPETGIDVIAAIRIEFNSEIPGVLVTGDTSPQRVVDTHGAHCGVGDSDTSLLHLLFSVALTQAVGQVQRQNR